MTLCKTVGTYQEVPCKQYVINSQNAKGEAQYFPEKKRKGSKNKAVQMVVIGGLFGSHSAAELTISLMHNTQKDKGRSKEVSATAVCTTLADKYCSPF